MTRVRILFLPIGAIFELILIIVALASALFIVVFDDVSKTFNYLYEFVFELKEKLPDMKWYKGEQK